MTHPRRARLVLRLDSLSALVNVRLFFLDVSCFTLLFATLKDL
jgi:hypothetical protein